MVTIARLAIVIIRMAREITFLSGPIIPGDQKLMFYSRLANLPVHDLRLRDPLS